MTATTTVSRMREADTAPSVTSRDGDTEDNRTDLAGSVSSCGAPPARESETDQDHQTGGGQRPCEAV